MEIPHSLQSELEKNKLALEIFNSLSNSHKMEYLKWITEAKTEQTRINRSFKAVEMLLKK